jgi:hypothetical protein
MNEIDPAQGFCIELSCLPDGTFNVSVETLEQEAEEPNEKPGQEAGSFEEAIKAVMAMYEQVSKVMPEGNPPGGSMGTPEETDAMAQGFSGVRGGGL